MTRTFYLARPHGRETRPASGWTAARSIRAVHLACLLLGVTSALAGAADLRGPGVSSNLIEVRAKVSFVSSDHVYLDAGADAGISPGDTLRIATGGATGRALVVDAVTRTTASCLFDGRTDLLVPGLALPSEGDAATGWIPRSATLPATADPAVPELIPAREVASGGNAPPASLRKGQGWGRVRGTAGVDWAHFEDSSGPSPATAPRLRLDLQGDDLLSRGVRVRASVRAGRSGRGSSLSALRSPEVRMLWASYASTGGTYGLAAGRLLVPEAGTFGYVDGLRGEFQPVSGWSVGAFGGRRPSWTESEARGRGNVAGAFARGRLRSPNVMGLVSWIHESGERAGDREWLLADGTVAPHPDLRLRARAQLLLRGAAVVEEIDGDSAEEPNASDGEDSPIVDTYLDSRISIHARYSPAREFAWSVGWDGSSLVLEHDVPPGDPHRVEELERSGWKSSVRWEPAGGWRLDGSATLRTSAGQPRRWSARGSFGRRALLALPLDARCSVRYYESPFARGTTPSLALEHASRRGWTLSSELGQHRTKVEGVGSPRVSTWLRVGGGIDLPGRVHLRVEWENHGGDELHGQRFYGRVLRRF